MEFLVFSMVISVISEVISVDFGDFGESCYPFRKTWDSTYIFTWPEINSFETKAIYCFYHLIIKYFVYLDFLHI